ncbi:hypothetical protein [Pseudonocardia sediminis]|uniref:hypothetical protein n=1 Tax=Pseudonocardia sediminis TaxID=1397368 RepID=UPI001029A368|nr:hypothetical protein [Pseudonocardia sediminis]
MIEVHGDLDAEMLDRLAAHIKDAFSARQRFLAIDVSAVTRSVPGLLDLLGRTQRRLARRHGLLTVRGFRPHLLPGVDIGVGAGRSPRPEPVRTRTPSRQLPS